MTTPWTAPKQEIAPGEYELALKAQYAAARQRLWSTPKPKPVEKLQLPAPGLAVQKAPRPKRRRSRFSSAHKSRSVFKPIEFTGNVLVFPISDEVFLKHPLTQERRTKLIIAACAVKWSVSVVEIMSQRRYKRLCRARQEAMSRVARKLPLSLPQIGRIFGGRDHTTVLHSLRKFESQPHLYTAEAVRQIK